MEIIRLKHPHHIKKEHCQPTVMALGYFDGVHIGHQKVIQTAKQIAKQHHYKSAVMSFHPHPSVVLKNRKSPIQYITPVDVKVKVVEECGVDIFYLVTFDHTLAELLPQQFVDDYIINLNVKHVVAGFDYTYGRLGKGTMETLPFHARRSFSQTVIDKVTIDGQKVSSTLIRQYILEGQVNKAEKYLGRFYEIYGRVIDGEKRGRTIGFPTANIEPSDDFLIPKVGVYAVKMKVKSKWYNGICNIGYKPTFHNEKANQPTIEVHLFEFNEDIYDEFVQVKWLKHIRNEKKFDSIEQLKSQIMKDKQKTIAFFKELNQ